MEQSKLFYESSTRQLVNILESLSSQLPGPCTTRHYEDTDSFDSVLSRRSSDHSSLIREETNIRIIIIIIMQQTSWRAQLVVC